MKRYRITLTPEDSREATVTVHYELNGTRPRITRFALDPAEGQSLDDVEIPTIDIKRLLGAIAPAVAAASARAVNVPAGKILDPDRGGQAPKVSVTATAPAPAGIPTDVSAHSVQNAATTDKPPTATPAKKTRSPKTPTPAKETTAPKTATRAKSTTAPKTAKKAAAAKKSAAVSMPDTKSERAYRKMPDDFVQTYGKTTQADLAAVYEVPLHTVTAWVQSARRQGLIPPAISRKKS
jgi:hypothetical protein